MSYSSGISAGNSNQTRFRFWSGVRGSISKFPSRQPLCSSHCLIGRAPPTEWCRAQICHRSLKWHARVDRGIIFPTYPYWWTGHAAFTRADRESNLICTINVGCAHDLWVMYECDQTFCKIEEAIECPYDVINLVKKYLIDNWGYSFAPECYS